MTTSRLIVVSSAHAYVDPSVQVHDAGCSHGLAKWYDQSWSTAGPFDSVAAAERAAKRAMYRVEAVNVGWCDCALLSAVR